MKRIQLNLWVLSSLASWAMACTIITNPAGSSDHDAGTGGAPSTDIDAGSDASMPAPSIEGSYMDDWGDPISITADTWTFGTVGDASLPSISHLVQVDNANSFAIAHNDVTYSYYPDLWSRFDWAWGTDHALRFCQTVYKAESAEQALQTPAADAQNFDTGCAGFAWSKLIPTS